MGEGERCDDKPHGQGTYAFADGSHCEGRWRVGKKHGRGIRTWADGSRSVFEYRDGEVWNGTVTFSDGTRVTCRNGVCK